MVSEKEVKNIEPYLKEIKEEIRTKKLKKKPLVELLREETEDEKNQRLKGGKLTEREWNIINEKCKKFLH